MKLTDRKNEFRRSRKRLTFMLRGIWNTFLRKEKRPQYIVEISDQEHYYFILTCVGVSSLSRAWALKVLNRSYLFSKYTSLKARSLQVHIEIGLILRGSPRWALHFQFIVCTSSPHKGHLISTASEKKLSSAHLSLQNIKKREVK